MTAAPQVVLATLNPGKVADFRILLDHAFGPGAVRSVGLDKFSALPTVVEDGVTFEHNARLKAAAYAAATGLPVVADDSGLVVEVMGRAPGVLSARWCGRHGDDVANLQLLLQQMGDVPDEHRGAQFECCAAFCVPGEEPVTRTGVFRGVLTRSPRGDGGFGYDPIFRVQGDHRTSAELSIQEKNAISHRGRALRELIPVIAAALGLPVRAPAGD